MKKRTNILLHLLAVSFLAACHTPKSPSIVAPQPLKLSPSMGVPVTSGPTFSVAQWTMLPEWNSLDLQSTWIAFGKGCRALKHKPSWKVICAHAGELIQDDNNALRHFFEENFTPYRIINSDANPDGLITGYYEPKLMGSREKTEKFRYPVYGVPDDLITIDLSEIYPQLKDLHVRGRLNGKRVIPYYTRAEIDRDVAELQGRELLWVDNAVDLFFMQIQGSGRIELPDGQLVKVGYADQNGYPYTSIGKKLIELGEITLDEASMQGIKKWAMQNPDKLFEILEKNASFIFFRELPQDQPSPLGALGVALTEAYSLAIDTRIVPLGSPVFLSTTYPDSGLPLNRLMLAQDVGGAIKGRGRADFFWGFGEQAGLKAGRMKQKGQMWVLFPKGSEPVLDVPN